MGLHTELRDAVDEGHSAVVQVLAEYEALPVEVEDTAVETANLLGGGSTPDFEFERQEGVEADEGHTLDRQTRKLAVEALGIDSVDACEEVQEEIRNHEAWGSKA